MAEQEYVDDKPWKLPKPFHIAPKASDRDTDQEAILAVCDAQQDEWRAKFASPGRISPQELERGRAMIIVDEYEQRGSVEGLKRIQRTEFADAYASIGRFDKAFEIHPDETARNEYSDTWDALQLPDDEVCECGTATQSVKKDIFSIFHSGVVSLIKCSACGHMNAKPTPDAIVKQRETRSKPRDELTGLTPLEAKARMIEMREAGRL